MKFPREARATHLVLLSTGRNGYNDLQGTSQERSDSEEREKEECGKVTSDVSGYLGHELIDPNSL